MDQDFEAMLGKIGIDARRHKRDSESTRRPTRPVDNPVAHLSSEAVTEEVYVVVDAEPAGDIEELLARGRDPGNPKGDSIPVFYPTGHIRPSYEPSQKGLEPPQLKDTRERRRAGPRPTVTMSPWSDQK